MITAINGGLRRLRLRLWLLGLRVRLRHHGARLVVTIGPGVRFESPPHVKIARQGDGSGTLVLDLAEGVSLGRDTTLEIWADKDNRLELGDGVYFTSNVRVQLRGGTISIGNHSHVRDSAVLRSSGRLTIGAHVSISFFCFLQCEEHVELGDHAGIAERVTLIDSDHSHDGSGDDFLAQPLRIAPVRIGRNTFVAANSMVLRGVTIGDNAAVGAGSVVVGGDLPGGWLYLGAPAKPMRRLGEPE